MFPVFLFYFLIICFGITIGTLGFLYARAYFRRERTKDTAKARTAQVLEGDRAICRHVGRRDK